MNIIVVGAGTVGFGLVKYFSQMEHNIALIEQNSELCEEINSKLDVFVVNGKGSSPSALENAGIKSADMIIAVTPSDETNILTCNFAMQNGVERRIARVKSDLYSNNSYINLEKTGVTQLIKPEKEVMQKVIQYIELPDVSETANFQENNIYLRGYKITEDMPIANKTLQEIKALAKNTPILFVAITRGGKNLPPTGNQKLLPGDNIVAIMHKESFKTFRSLINRKPGKLNKIIVSGDTLTAIHLAQALKPICEQISLADPDLEHGKKAASTLEGIDVLHGDSTDSDFVQEIGVKDADCFIAAGEDTEDNIMSCILTKSEGAKAVIAIRENQRHSNLFQSLGIDHIINPQQITLHAIIEKIHTVAFGPYLKLKTADIEVLRLKAKEKSPVTGKTLKNLDKIFDRSIIVGSIIRSGEIIIPDGNTTINNDDEVIVLCNKKHIKLVSKKFN